MSIPTPPPSRQVALPGRPAASRKGAAPLARAAARFALAAALLLLSAGGAGATPASSGWATGEHIRVELISELRSVVPGEPFQVALRLVPDPGWHTYWINPGDSGLETRMRWELAPGAAAGPIQWPAPRRLPVAHLVNYGFEGETFLLTTLRPPATLDRTGVFTATAEVDWLVCEVDCIPGSARLSLRLPVSSSTGEPETAHAGDFARARARLPRPVDWPAHYTVAAGELQLRLETADPELGEARELSYFPAAKGLVDHGQAQRVIREPEAIRFAQAASPYFQTAPERLEGVLVADTPAGPRAYTFTADPEALAGGPEAPGAPAPALALAILLALGGGLLLNLMPCVFPVLSLKAISLARSAGHGPRARALHGLVYTAGVLASFALVAAALLALRSGGAAVGWGFQLQSPWFVGLLAYLLFVLALSLSGLLELGTRFMGIGGGLAAAPGYRGSFFTGVLATVVASPCTAPFMGTALGFAVTQPTAVALTVFLALGLGMALPFLVLGFVPAAGRWLPRPGPWMETFKQAMAFPLYLTVVWLLWVLGRQTGPDGMGAALLGLVLLALALWLWGRPARAAVPWLRHGTAALAAVAALGLLALPQPAGSEAASAQPSLRAGAQPFSETRLQNLRAEDRVVLVNMTADWCITCLANEQAALGTERVRAAMAAAGAAYLVGDWTRRDPAITAYLARFERNGVPLYVVYHPGAEPRVLPQILTPALVAEAIAGPAAP